MNDRILIDTNILVYTKDSNEPDKMEIVRGIIDKLMGFRGGIVWHIMVGFSYRRRSNSRRMWENPFGGFEFGTGISGRFGYQSFCESLGLAYS